MSISTRSPSFCMQESSQRIYEQPLTGRSYFDRIRAFFEPTKRIRFNEIVSVVEIPLDNQGRRITQERKPSWYLVPLFVLRNGRLVPYLKNPSQKLLPPDKNGHYKKQLQHRERLRRAVLSKL